MSIDALYAEIRERLEEGGSCTQIAAALGCRRETVARQSGVNWGAGTMAELRAAQTAAKGWGEDDVSWSEITGKLRAMEARLLSEGP
jgi:hypothetical protein